MNNGVVLYNIESNGCLNGVYTNDGVSGEIFNEIARLQINGQRGEDGISGIYDCLYFDLNNSSCKRSLKISVSPQHSARKIYTYTFEWSNENVMSFKGTGYRMNETQIVVHYTNA